MKCVKCETMLDDGANFCTSCEAAQKLVCNHCRSEVSIDTKLCPNCGKDDLREPDTLGSIAAHS